MRTAEVSDILILIPCKGLDRGKSRLTEYLDQRSRRALCEFFLCRTLALATSVVPAQQVQVITSDPRAERIAAEYGASHLPDCGIDLNSALSGARSNLVGGAFETFGALVLPVDLPCANAAALQMVLTARADVTIVPDSEGQGTNALFLKQQAFRKFRFAFGPNSFAKHCAAARDAGLAIEIIKDACLAFDVDVPGQYARWIEDTNTSSAYN